MKRWMLVLHWLHNSVPHCSLNVVILGSTWFFVTLNNGSWIADTSASRVLMELRTCTTRYWTSTHNCYSQVDRLWNARIHCTLNQKSGSVTGTGNTQGCTDLAVVWSLYNTARGAVYLDQAQSKTFSDEIFWATRCWMCMEYKCKKW